MIAVNTENPRFKRYICRLCLKITDLEDTKFADYTSNSWYHDISDSDPTSFISLGCLVIDLFFQKDHKYEFEMTAYIEEKIFVPKYPEVALNSNEYTGGLGVAFARVKGTDLSEVLNELKRQIGEQFSKK